MIIVYGILETDRDNRKGTEYETTKQKHIF